MATHETDKAYQVGHEALVDYYRRVAPRPRQSLRRWAWRGIGAVGLATFLALTANTMAGSGNEDPNAGRGDDRSYENEYNPDGGSRAGNGEGTVAAQPNAPSSPESALRCKIGALTVIDPSSSIHKFVLNLEVQGADITSPNTRVVMPLVNEGRFVPAGNGGAVVLNPDGSRTAEVPADSTAGDVYGVYVQAGGDEALCGGVYFEGPDDRYPGIVDDDQLPAHT